MAATSKNYGHIPNIRTKPHILMKLHPSDYHKRGKIRWAKLLQIPPNEVIHRKNFVVPYV